MSGFTLYLIEVLPGLSLLIGALGFFTLLGAAAVALNALDMKSPAPKEADYEAGAFPVALARWKTTSRKSNTGIVSPGRWSALVF